MRGIGRLIVIIGSNRLIEGRLTWVLLSKSLSFCILADSRGDVRTSQVVDIAREVGFSSLIVPVLIYKERERERYIYRSATARRASSDV